MHPAPQDAGLQLYCARFTEGVFVGVELKASFRLQEKTLSHVTQEPCYIGEHQHSQKDN